MTKCGSYGEGSYNDLGGDGGGVEEERERGGVMKKGRNEERERGGVMKKGRNEKRERGG